MPPIEHLILDQKRKLGLVSRIRKSITKFDLKPSDLGFETYWFSDLADDVSQKPKIRINKNQTVDYKHKMKLWFWQ